MAAIVQLIVGTAYYATLGAAVTSGNSIICIGVDTPTSGITATFNGDAMTGANLGADSVGYQLWYFYRHNHTSGGTQIITAGGSNFNILICYEVSGLNNAVPEVAQKATGNSASPNPGAYSVTSGAFGATWIHESGGAPSAAPSGWTLDSNQSSHWYCGRASIIFPSGGSQTTNWSISSAAWGCGVLSFAPTGGAAAVSLPFPSRHRLPHLIVR